MKSHFLSKDRLLSGSSPVRVSPKKFYVSYYEIWSEISFIYFCSANNLILSPFFLPLSLSVLQLLDKMYL